MSSSSLTKILMCRSKTATCISPTKGSGKLQKKISFVRKLLVRVFNFGK